MTFNKSVHAMSIFINIMYLHKHITLPKANISGATFYVIYSHGPPLIEGEDAENDPIILYIFENVPC